MDRAKMLKQLMQDGQLAGRGIRMLGPLSVSGEQNPKWVWDLAIGEGRLTKPNLKIFQQKISITLSSNL